MRFVWFWTFWHWSREGFRTGSLLRGPLHGIGPHWDEWFRHEASDEDRRAIEDAGRSRSTQRQFLAWLRREWASEAGWGKGRVVPRYVLQQLAPLPPFDAWSELRHHRPYQGERGPAAIVLAENSPGEKEDVRMVAATALPIDSGTGPGPLIEPLGFRVDESELATVSRATLSMLGGKGLLTLLCWWMVAGRRPYPRPLRVGLGLAWLSLGAAFGYLLIGPDPGPLLLPLLAALVGTWGCLVIAAAAVAGKICFDAWRLGRHLGLLLRKSRVRLRMDSGLTVKGGSAGLAFCLNTLLALHRSAPAGGGRSWLWSTFFHRLRSGGKSWAATGLVTPDARVKAVVIEPKLRACLEHGAIEHLLVPRQRVAGPPPPGRPAGSLPPARQPAGRPAPEGIRVRLGYAAEGRRFEVHRSSHLGQSILTLGRLRSRWQPALNFFAVVVTAALVLASPDVLCILAPPPAPTVTAPASPSPYFLWVSLETGHPRCFRVVLESEFWSNRRAEVAVSEGSPVPRAEIRLHRLARPVSNDEEDGTVWVERRRSFLSREFAPGERVGCYSLAYLSHLGHE